VKKLLEIWPPIPISLRYGPTIWGDENIIAALEHRDRVSDILFYWEKIPELERFAAVMQEPFPALTSLMVASHGYPALVLPEAFLGGSAPSLRTVALEGIDFPALPRLLLSAPHLVSLKLDTIPVSASISPESMATCLATSINLENLDIEFQAPSSHPGLTCPPSFPRAIFPSLSSFTFKGISEHLEDFVARIDAPILRTLLITFKGSNLHVSQTLRFINRAQRFTLPKSAVFGLRILVLSLKFGPSDSFALEITCDNVIEGELAVSLICRKLSPLLSHVACLDLYGVMSRPWPPWWYFIHPTQWLEFFRPFIATQSLRVSHTLGHCLSQALQEISREADAGLLPELRTLFLEGSQPLVSAPAAWEPFVAARQLSGRPLDVQPWEP